LLTALALAALAAAALLVWLAWPGAGGGVPSPEAGGPGATAALQGSLREWASDQGIPDGQVRLSCPGHETRLARTDARGEFTFPDPPEAGCLLEASAPGHAASARRREAHLELRARPGLLLEGLDLVLYRTAEVSGRVRLYGQPAPGARLSLLVLESPGEHEAFALELEAESGPDGAYRLGDLGPGRLQVVAELGQHPPGESQEVFLRGGERVPGLDIELGRGGLLEVRVLTARGAPLAGVSLRLLSEGRRRPEEGLTDAQGRLTFERVPPGGFRLSAHKPGHGRAAPREGRLEADQRLELEVRLEEIPGLVGRVSTRDGRPVAGAAVFALAEGAPPAPQARPAAFSRADGAFFASGPFEADRVRLWASHREHGPSDPVLVRPDAGGEIHLVLGEPGGLQGRAVSARDGAPVPHFEVRLTRTGGPPGEGLPFHQRAFRDPSGRFEFPRLAPGEYLVEVQSLGFTPGRRPGQVVRAGRRSEVGDVALGPGGALTGRVVDDRSGAPLPGASVSHAHGGAQRGRAQTDAQGRFRVAATAERQSLQVSRPGYLTELLSGVEAPPGGERDLGDVRLEPDPGGGRGAFRYGGMGAQLSYQDGRLVVGEVFDGSPAAGAGLPRGAEILRIDGLEVSELDLERAVELIRGEPGSEVTLDVLLPGMSHPQLLRILRQRIKSR
jgi:hypothetical protein